MIESLRITLDESLEFNRADARKMAGAGFEKALIAAHKTA